MLDIRFSSQLPANMPQSRLLDNKCLLSYSAVSAFVHIAVLAILVAWTGGRARFLPPVQVITIDISGINTVPQKPPPVVPARRQTVPARMAAPPQPVRSVPSPVPAMPRDQAAIPVADSTPAAAPTPVVATAGSLKQPIRELVRPASPALPTHASSAPPTPPKAPQTTRATDNATVRAGYMQRCRGLIERHKEYPVMARKGRIEGTVMIRGTLGRDGSLSKCQLARSSGSVLLDNAAMRAVRSVDRFPPAPPELLGDELVFELPISFRISMEQRGGEGERLPP